MSDSAAFHEVDDAVRKDELKEWWGRWGTWVVGAAVVLVVVVAGLVGWRQYDAAQRAAASAAYSAALAKIAQDQAAARAELEQAGDERARALSLAGRPGRRAAARAPGRPGQPPWWRVAPTLSSAELADLAKVIAAFKSVDAGKAEEHGGQARAAGRTRPAVPC